MTAEVQNLAPAKSAAGQVASLTPDAMKNMAGQSLFQLALGRLRRDRLTLICLAILFFLSLVSILAPVITGALGVDYSNTEAKAFLPLGTPGHWLGTDDLGRDYLARLVYGGQVSLSIAFLAAMISLVIGILMGVVAGYVGGFVDDVINWVIVTLGSVPSLFILLILSAIFRPTPTMLILALGLLGWLGTARLVRGETLAIRQREYILGAVAIGVRPWRIMILHVVPNLFSIVVISLALDIGGLILTEAGLSFLGYGVKDVPSWGNMLTNAETLFTYGAHLVFLPGFMITLTVLCLYVIGDGLRDALDPQLSKR